MMGVCEVKNVSDLISRQDAIDAIYHKLPNKTMDECRAMLHDVPSAQPDGDLVSRQTALDALSEVYINKGITTIHWTGVKALLEFIPSAQPEQRWIPCSSDCERRCDKWEHLKT